MKGKSMTLVCIGDILRDAPVRSAEFRVAMDAVNAAIKEARTPEGENDTYKEYFDILRSRRWSDEDLVDLTGLVGSCNVAILFIPEIPIEPDAPPNERLAAVWRFFINHLRSCERCTGRFITAKIVTELFEAHGSKPSPAN